VPVATAVPAVCWAAAAKVVLAATVVLAAQE
jgi:hypothetical protein